MGHSFDKSTLDRYLFVPKYRDPEHTISLVKDSITAEVQAVDFDVICMLLICLRRRMDEIQL